MSKFNQKQVDATLTTNEAGGQAHKQSSELELVSILLTSFANDQFYKSGNETLNSLKRLIQTCNPKFSAQAAIYARTKFGMRSISHVAASELAIQIGGCEWAKDFYNAVIYRPDDMLEIISYHKANNGKISNAMKKGFAHAFDKFDGYQLAKYRGEGKGIKLIDVVNLVHPVPIEKNAEAMRLLTKGELKSTETWESKLTVAGQTATNEVELGEMKKDAWVSLIRERKLGYFALLKNLRNIINQAPEIITEAIAMLTDEALIKKSLVLPFRFITAFNEIKDLPISIARQVMVGISQAIEISLSNIPKYDGETLVVLDVSGSMQGKPADIGGLFAACLAKANNCDVITFDDRARYVNVNTMDSISSIMKSIPFTGGGTNFNVIFQTANKKYDRIIILSDMQGWIGYHTPSSAYNSYKNIYKANPYIYSFDLAGHGTMQFPENKVFAIAGFSDKVFDLMKLLESDKKAMVNEIKSVKF